MRRVVLSVAVLAVLTFGVFAFVPAVGACGTGGPINCRTEQPVSIALVLVDSVITTLRVVLP